jgi:EmrB/QacA subfamily drug resistance transporter
VEKQARAERRWVILVVLCVAQLMVVLDATVINIALPQAQHSLRFSNTNRQWVITAYAFSFGSLLLLGGRLSDRWGRKHALVIGLVGFAAASAVGGAATSFGMLVGARAAQGAFGALLAPSTLAMLSSTFREPKARARAYSVFGAVGASGAAIGFLVGGSLTQRGLWRWCLYANIVFAVVALAGTFAFIRRAGNESRVKLDFVGAVLAAGGFFFLVYGLEHAVGATDTNWRATHSWGSLAIAGVLLGLFAAWQRRSTHPLLPWSVLRNRSRAGAQFALFITSFGSFAISLFLAVYLQNDLHYSPLKTGVAFLPLVLAIAVSAGVASARLLPITGPRTLVPAGMLLGVMGMVLFTRLPTSNEYLSHVFPGLIVTGLGIGLIVGPAIAAATSRVRASDTGAAAAAVSTNQQIGGSIGASLLGAVALVASSSSRAPIDAEVHWFGQAPVANVAVTVHGYSVAFWWAAAFFGVGTIVTAILLDSRVPQFGDDVALAEA